MSPAELAENWSHQFGLALGPLFELGESPTAHQHYVLLDGGYGSFVLSASEDELWRKPDVAGWVWSSDIPHHVTITRSKVGVLRWDRPTTPRVFERRSVERSIERFYDYLIDDRLRSNKTVVDHLLGFFRRIRSLVNYAGIEDSRTTDVFIATLASMIAPDDLRMNPENYGVAEDVFDLTDKVSSKGLVAARAEIRQASGSLSLLDLNPALAVRHASGQLFQEAHFELLRAPASLDLFGLIGTPDVKITGRGGTHFTPPALARILVEQALAALDDLTSRHELSICDPACGSGAFLYEALRALRRLGYKGRLTIIGQDVSAAAIAMAKFVLRRALNDWAPQGGIDLRLQIGDSLGELGIPVSDLIVMNPPFIAFGSQTPLQREQISAAMEGMGTSRGDFSMAFIVRAVEALKSGGVLGALFPASLLSLNAAEHWREKLADSGQIRFLASIGDFGLFAHALIQVAAAIIKKSPPAVGAEVIALVTENDARATGAALRVVRKLGASLPSTPVSETSWSLFSVPASSLKTRSTWRFPSPRTERALRTLEDAQLATIGELFKVRQGIQTGLNNALLLSRKEWKELPIKERGFFRLATMSDSIQNGRIVRPYYVFFPHTIEGPRFENEDKLVAAMPTYFRRFLKGHRERLTNRAAIRRANRTDWWGLMHPREWSLHREPRIISKFFAAAGGFADDCEAQYLPVMGHAWFPTNALKDKGDAALALQDILYAYVALLNSAPFIKLLAIFSPHVAGGQFDLSSRHVEPIPIPNLHDVSLEASRGRTVSYLAEQGRTIDLANPAWCSRTDQLVASLYGPEIIASL